MYGLFQDEKRTIKWLDLVLWLIIHIKYEFMPFKDCNGTTRHSNQECGIITHEWKWLFLLLKIVQCEQWILSSKKWSARRIFACFALWKFNRFLCLLLIELCHYILYPEISTKLMYLIANAYNISAHSDTYMSVIQVLPIRQHNLSMTKVVGLHKLSCLQLYYLQHIRYKPRVNLT